MQKIGERTVYSVTEINRIARQSLESITLWIEGEVCNFAYKEGRYRYVYFTLKDTKTEYLLPCRAEPNYTSLLEFPFKNGARVMMYGNLTLYEREGKYQFAPTIIELFGESIIQKRLEELKKKLQKEGLFSEDYKIQIPEYPVKIGVVTSIKGTGAAWFDFKAHTYDKYPFLEIIVHDVFVQGDNAVLDISKAIRKLDQMNLDVIVVTRGGGSLEDLMAFNSEEIARAIFACKTPILSAVGHEKDFSISDLVADVRASSPTAAANLLVANYPLFFEKIDNLYLKIQRSIDDYFSDHFSLLDDIFFHLQNIKNVFKDLPAKLLSIGSELKRQEVLTIYNNKTKLRDLFSLLQNNSIRFIEKYSQRLKILNEKILILSPQTTLLRGYSIVSDKKGKTIRDSHMVEIGENINIKLARGALLSEIKEKKNG